MPAVQDRWSSLGAVVGIVVITVVAMLLGCTDEPLLIVAIGILAAVLGVGVGNYFREQIRTTTASKSEQERKP
jgi:hypothetical protein